MAMPDRLIKNRKIKNWLLFKSLTKQFGFSICSYFKLKSIENANKVLTEKIVTIECLQFQRENEMIFEITEIAAIFFHKKF